MVSILITAVLVSVVGFMVAKAFRTDRSKPRISSDIPNAFEFIKFALQYNASVNFTFDSEKSELIWRLKSQDFPVKYTLNSRYEITEGTPIERKYENGKLKSVKCTKEQVLELVRQAKDSKEFKSGKITVSDPETTDACNGLLLNTFHFHIASKDFIVVRFQRRMRKVYASEAIKTDFSNKITLE